jgi:hypothetical protein
VWLGLRRRQSYRWLFVVLVVNAALLALLGLLQQLTGADRIFWTYHPSNPLFAASFIYRNHTGAYLNLLLALAVGLAWWHFTRAQRRGEKSSPAVVFVFLAAVVAVMILFTYSRFSILLLLGFLALAAGGFFLRQLLGAGGLRRHAGPALFALVCLAFAATAGVSLGIDKVWTRFATVWTDPAASARSRTLARHAAEAMLGDRWRLGWGAGCFRYNFPRYANQAPEIYNAGGGQIRFWEHAHCDLLEFPIEFGAVGMLPLLVALGWGAARLVRQRVWRNPLALLVLLGGLLTLVHAGADFVFQSPAILLTWAVLMLAAIRWAELDAPALLSSGVVRPR